MASRCTAAARAIRILLVDDTESVRRALRLILSRIKEAIDRGATNDAAASEGIKATADTVTNAATIMVGVFAVFAMLRVLELKEVGVGLGVAMLLPASMKLLGNANWYLPLWLGWLLHITIESPAVIDEQSAPATEREYAYADLVTALLPWPLSRARERGQGRRAIPLIPDPEFPRRARSARWRRASWTGGG